MERNKIDEYYNQARNEMLEFVPQNAKKILECGCSKGFFGKVIKARQDCQYWAIELDEESANIAKQHLDNVLIGTIEEKLLEVQNIKFDCIIFNDVLEHLVDPYKILIECKKYLSPNGVIVSSIPNIRYYQQLYFLIFHKTWEYTEYGILDRTHLRFFTYKSLILTFKRLNYEIIKIEGINKTQNKLFHIFNFLTFRFFDDCKYLQFASVVKAKE